MIRLLIFCLVLLSSCVSHRATTTSPTAEKRVKDDMLDAATAFMQTLSPEQQRQVTYPLADEERYNWHYVPRERKGLSMRNMTETQRQAAMTLLKTGLSQQGYERATGIMDMENVLRVIDNRPPNDTYRDPTNYSFTIFGNPAAQEPWSWRVEGHHLSLHFLSRTGKVLAQTPTFFGINPAVLAFDSTMADKRMQNPRIKDLPQKGKRLFERETDLAFDLLKSLNADQRKQVIVDAVAYPEIVTANKRKASIERMDGLKLADMTKEQRAMFMELLQVYLKNYRITLAKQQMDKLEQAGLDNLRFAWAGDLTPELSVGKGWYYRIHGPTILIEYDNTQTNANHIHTVVRDLTNDFGEDLLQEHYRNSAHTGKP
ncbi:MAG: DUF3500 domain-containing protein [Spirosoma sp.]|nr:DUF3500 domain-containing protein [Spirosoma sp.]